MSLEPARIESLAVVQSKSTMDAIAAASGLDKLCVEFMANLGFAMIAATTATIVVAAATTVNHLSLQVPQHGVVG